MSTNEKISSVEAKPKVAIPAQIEILSILVQEFVDWMDEHENDASLRRQLVNHLRMAEGIRRVKLLVDQDDPRTKEFREKYFAAIARGKKALEAMPSEDTED